MWTLSLFEVYLLTATLNHRCSSKFLVRSYCEECGLSAPRQGMLAMRCGFFTRTEVNVTTCFLLQWSPNTVVLWDNRVTAHVSHASLVSLPLRLGLLMISTTQTAILDYIESKERRHGARITPQAERPIPALEGLDLRDPHGENWHDFD